VSTVAGRSTTPISKRVELLAETDDGDDSHFLAGHRRHCVVGFQNCAMVTIDQFATCRWQCSPQKCTNTAFRSLSVAKTCGVLRLGGIRERLSCTMLRLDWLPLRALVRRFPSLATTPRINTETTIDDRPPAFEHS
jgi:hypothetical protein